jgi:hypothetical protein
MADDKELYCSVTNTTGIMSATVNDDYGQPTRTALIEATATTLELGDAVTVDLGYQDSHAQVFTGYVIDIGADRTPNGVIKTLRCRDQLWRAMAYFIAASDPQDPLTYSNIASEDLVKAMLDLASISSYSLDSPGFTFAPEEPLEVNLMSSWDMIARICQLIAWHCYDNNGTVRFLDRKPYPVGGDSSVHTYITGDTGEILAIQPFSKSSDKIRNRVVVYGLNDISAEASASSPFLPDGFYKTEVISAPDLIDTQQMAQDIADYNLDLLNRLEKQMTMQAAGVPTVAARQVVTVTESETGASGDWFVYSCSHDLKDAYTNRMTLVQRQTS